MNGQNKKDTTTAVDARVYVDALTGLYNRYYYEERFNDEVHRSNRNKIPFSVIAMDIDFFKQYNDDFGHEEGDKALKAVSQSIMKHIREIDYAFRIGGEEFMVILPYTDSVGATIVAEKIRRRIEAIDFLKRKLTVSGGVATYLRDTVNPRELYPVADKKLYRAKSLGRNQICSDSETQAFFDKLEFFVKKNLAMLKYRKGRVFFICAFIFLIVSFAGYYRHFSQKQEAPWEKVYKENFTQDSFDKNWAVNRGAWQMKDNELVAVESDSLSYLLTNRGDFSGSYRVVVDGYFEKGVQISDLSLYVDGNSKNPMDGYFIGVSANENWRHKIRKKGKEVAINIGKKMDAGELYHLEVLKSEDRIDVSLNNQRIFRYWDFFPSKDFARNKISLYTFYPGLHITNFEVYLQKKPELVSIFMVPDKLFSLGHYEDALQEYQLLNPSYEGTAHYDMLLFKQALCYMKVDNFEKAKEKLKYIIHAGKNVELNPYAKMELTHLYLEEGRYSLALERLGNHLSDYRNDRDVLHIYFSFVMNTATQMAVYAPRISNQFFQLYLDHASEDRFGVTYALTEMMENYLVMGDYRALEKTYNKLLESDGELRDLAFSGGLVYVRAMIEQGFYDQAFLKLDDMQKHYKDLDYLFPRLFVLKAQLIFLQGKTDVFRTFYEEIDRSFPQAQSLEIVQVKSLWALYNALYGEEEYGLTLLNSLCKSFPETSVNQLYPNLYLGYYYYAVGSFEKARSHLHLSKEFTQVYRRISPDVDVLVGLSFLNEGNTAYADSAFQKLKKSAATSLQNYCAQYMLFELLPEELVYHYAQYKSKEDDVYFYMAEKARAGKNIELAEKYYLKSLELSPSNEYPAFIVEKRLASMASAQ